MCVCVCVTFDPLCVTLARKYELLSNLHTLVLWSTIAVYKNPSASKTQKKMKPKETPKQDTKKKTKGLFVCELLFVKAMQ